MINEKSRSLVNRLSRSLAGLFAVFLDCCFGLLQSPEILSILPVPGRNHDRNRALALGLTGETDQRLRLGGVDIAKLLDLLSFARRHIRKFLSATDYTYPAGAARSRATLNRNRTLDAARIDRAPVTRLIFGGTPGQVLSFAQFVFGSGIVLVPGHGPLLVHG